MDAQRTDGGLAEFYASNYRNLVAVVGVVARDRAAAEEAVQEAFVRLISRWSRIASYDDPRAWVLTVALRVHRNAARKQRNMERLLPRLVESESASSPGSETADVARALEFLTLPHREVIVLAWLGYGPDESAVLLGIPAGTAKSRLSRARAVLSAHLKGDEHGQLHA